MKSKTINKFCEIRKKNIFFDFFDFVNFVNFVDFVDFSHFVGTVKFKLTIFSHEDLTMSVFEGLLFLADVVLATSVNK